MPTVVDPQIKEQTNSNLAATPELFAAEIQMEKKSSELGSLVMVIALLAIVGRHDLLLFQNRSRGVDAAACHRCSQRDIEGPGRQPD